MASDAGAVDDPPGIVGIISQDSARFTAFPVSLTGLDLPAGSEIVWKLGHQVATQTNRLVEALMEQPDKRWLWILGDDHAFSPGLLRRLLAHDVDIVVPLCLTRFPPYRPVVFSGFAPDGRHRLPLHLDDYQDGSFLTVHSAGSAGMLIRREVFERMNAPWFESYQVTSQEFTEDLYFCDKARALGFDVWCDLDAHLGHCITGTVWPVKERSGWTHGFSMAGDYIIRIPTKEER